MSHGSAHPDGHSTDRRGFLASLSLLLSAAVALFGAVIAGVFAVGPAISAKDSEESGTCPTVPGAGSGASRGPRLETVTVVVSSGWSRANVKHAVFVDEASDGALRVFSARCPHEGCRVDWRPASNEYVCPCHDSRFTREGERVAGPTRRGLDPLAARRAADGSIEVCYKTFALDTPDRIEVG